MGKIWGRFVAIVCALLLLQAPNVFAEKPVSFKIYRVADVSASPEFVISVLAREQEKLSAMPALTPMPRVEAWWRIEFTAVPAASQRHFFYLSTMGLGRSKVLMTNGKVISISQLELNANHGFSPRVQAVLLPATLKAGDSMYWQIRMRDNVPISAGILPEDDLRRLDTTQSRWHSLIEGIILSLVLAGFALSALLREKNFILLSAGTFFSWLYVIANNGNIFYYSVLAKWELHIALTRVFGFACVILMAHFVYVFLDMRNSTPRLAMLLKYIITIFCFLLVFSLIPVIGNLSIIAYIANIAAVLAILTIAGAAIILVKRGNHLGRMLLLSWSPLFVFALWRLLELSLGFEENPALSILFPISFVLACVLMYSGLGERMLHYKRERDINEQLARMDSLTDVYNRRALDERLRLAAQTCEKAGNGLALLFVDIDHFKQINDTNGHDAGDAVLKIITQRMRTALRFGDVLGRYGGEEFVIALPDCDQARALALANRIRQSVADEPVCFGNASVRVTVSIGVSVLYEGPAGIDQALRQADQALYQCKQNGRNQVAAISKPI